jgi:fatty-acyl-CoA synthase
VAFLVSARFAALAEAVREGTPAVAHRFCVGGAVEGHRPLEAALADVPGTPLEGAVAGADMLYSSGTTGRPKGIAASAERRPLDAPELFTEVMRRVLDVRPGDVYLSPAPLYHAAPLRGCMSVHRLGGTVVVLRRFDAETVLRLVERHGVTHGQFVPTMLLRMLRLPDEVRTRHDLSSLRAVVHAGAPCPPEVKRAMIDWWGPIVHEYYGATEGCGVTWVTSEEWLAHPGTVGRAVVGTVTSSTMTAPSSGRGRPAPSGSRAARPSPTTRTRPRRPRRTTARAGRPSATWAAWTRTATST